MAATPGTLVLGVSPANYLRQNVTLDGQRLTLSGAPAQFPVSVTDRGRSQRIDLVLETVPADSDGDGLADAWEQQYFSGLGADPNADSDESVPIRVGVARVASPVSGDAGAVG